MHESIGEGLDAIDREVVRQFTAIAVKSSISAEAPPTALVKVQSPASPDMVAVPAGALALPRSYVERSGFQGAVDDLINPEEAFAPFSVVGMGGEGKSVLASAIVRDSRVRQHFRGGAFWVRVGSGANKSLLPILQGLGGEMGTTRTKWSPRGAPQLRQPGAGDEASGDRCGICGKRPSSRGAGMACGSATSWTFSYPCR